MPRWALMKPLASETQGEDEGEETFCEKAVDEKEKRNKNKRGKKRMRIKQLSKK